MVIDKHTKILSLNMHNTVKFLSSVGVKEANEKYEYDKEFTKHVVTSLLSDYRDELGVEDIELTPRLTKILDKNALDLIHYIAFRDCSLVENRDPSVLKDIKSQMIPSLYGNIYLSFIESVKENPYIHDVLNKNLPSSVKNFRHIDENKSNKNFLRYILKLLSYRFSLLKKTKLLNRIGQINKERSLTSIHELNMDILESFSPSFVVDLDDSNRIGYLLGWRVYVSFTNKISVKNIANVSTVYKQVSKK